MTAHSAKSRPLVISSLGGNEAYCLRLKGMTPGHMVVGNSVQSMGFIGGLAAGLRNLAGGESPDVTGAIKAGRDAALARMVAEARQVGGHGISGVSSDVRSFSGSIEFLSTGSAIHAAADSPVPAQPFGTSFDGKELFCVMDAGYTPLHFAFGNIAYSIGVGGGLIGGLKTFVRGEIAEFSSVLNTTRHAALARLVHEAQAAGANAVLGVETDITSFAGFHEMLMTGTAARHPALEGPCATCDLTADEIWSLAQMGFAPLRIVMGTAVYSLGFVGGLKTLFKSFTRGEIPDLTTMVYDAREHALDLLEAEATACGADGVMGTDVYIHELGNGLVEFMAIGTAIKKHAGVKPASPQLPPQAVSIHRATFRNSFDELLAGADVRQ